MTVPTVAHCRLCGDDYRADLVVRGECYLCRDALDGDRIDDATSAELCAIIDAERDAFFASLDYAPGYGDELAAETL
jgi:hypothetical protein